MGSESGVVVSDPTTVLEPRGLLEAIASGRGFGLRHVLYSILPADARFGPRRLYEHVVWYVVAGRMHGEVAGKPVVIEPGMVSWRSPGVADRFAVEPASAPVRVYSLRFSVAGRLAPDHRLLPGHEGLVRRFDDLEAANRRRADKTEPVVRAALVLLVEQLLARETGSGDAGFSPAAVTRMQRLLDERAAAGVRPADLASAVGLSPDHFARKFRRHFGMPPRRWIQRQRMRKAANLLAETTLSVKEVAAALGYDDQRFFARVFRQAYGVAPTRYRASKGLEGDSLP